MELHLPPNTTITDRYGKIVRQVSITPVPLDKLPFPLPAGVDVPIYFTVQPGGAYIKVGYSKGGPKGARLIYPNGFNLKPGTLFDFWNYDADAKGWFIYGNGKVSNDGKNIIPDPGVVIYEFTGAMVGGSSGVPTKARPKGSKPGAGDPVDLSTGLFIYAKTDLAPGCHAHQFHPYLHHQWQPLAGFREPRAGTSASTFSIAISAELPSAVSSAPRP